MHVVSRRASGTTPFMVMEILEKAQVMQKSGEDVVHLEVGEPDFDTPACIKEAAIKAIGEGKTKYTHSMGLPELREEISRYYKREFAPALMKALHDSNNAIRVQAATVIAKLEQEYMSSFMKLSRQLQADPEDMEVR